jgi:hypothetical protein
MKLRNEILLFFFVLLVCSLAMRAEDAKPKPKAGEEVKATELEAAKLGKLKAQLDRLQVQQALLQQQYNQLLAEGGRTQAKIDALVKDVEARVKKEQELELTYDQAAGEDGVFHVAAPPPPPTPPAKK